MANRPNYIDLNTGDLPRIGIPSPRKEYFDGEIPPALSPLDAFAAQGRMLAKQLDESMRRDRRMSRLPPASVARSLSQPRPGYFRTPSSERARRLARSPTHSGSPEVEEPKFRPHSEHPRFSGLSTLASESGYEEDGNNQTPMTNPPEPRQPTDYFDIPRAESPEEDLSLRVNHNDNGSHGLAAPIAMEVPVPGVSRDSSMDSVSKPSISKTLAPPASPLPRPHSSSSRLAHPESSDDDYTSSTAGSTFSKPRKLSSSSGMSMPHSPMSFVRPHPRSPSLSSEHSNAGSHLARPSFNFSRPMSRSSTSLSAPSPGETVASHQSSGMSRERKPSPITVPSHPGTPVPPDDDASTSGVSSYTYAKYELPRGRAVTRDSLVFSGLQTPHFEWKEPLFESPPPITEPCDVGRARTPSPPPISHRSTSKTPERSAKPQSVHGSPARSMKQPERASPASLRPSAEVPNPSLTVSKSEEHDETKSTSADSGSTLRPQTAQSGISVTTALTAEDHVTKGIECHEKGSLQESTYHLRIAAKQNHPTGMLLYALACRHGWGMRPNQREGVQWLRKAVDAVGIDLKGNGTSHGTSRAVGMLEEKTRRAQFALSVYELGVSHLNGWGVEQDKVLALRCFEIAAQWGDADAMAEAGYCYAEGVGCKKDMKKAAKYYRMAEANGMNMVGNSWYV